MEEDFFGFVAAFFLLSVLVVVLLLGIAFAIPAAIALAIGYGVYQHHHGPAAQAKRIEAETSELYQKALGVQPLSYNEFVAELEAELCDERLIDLAKRLFEEEGFLPPDPPPPNVASIEGGRYRDQLNKYLAASHSRERARRFVSTLKESLRPLDRRTSAGMFQARRSRTPDEIEDLIYEFFDEHDFFKSLRYRLDQNLKEQKGIMPSDYSGSNCAWDYLKDTPLLPLEYINTSAEWIAPENHTLVLAGSGAGKTTLFKHLIAHKLKEDCCVIVMDSQSQLIEELAHLELDEDELAWISPEHPLALNPFYADDDELADEAFINNAIGQLEFVINKLLDAPMTPRQRTLFHHCTNLVLTIPEGDIGMFFEVLKDPYEFAPYIDELDETSRRFFFEELRKNGKKGSPYDSTRTELSYRIDALLKNPTLRRIFNTEENTFSMFEEMLDRKLILIDTSHSLLAEESSTFGRFMIAQALQACYRRVKEKKTVRPVIFFVDEAHEYFDEKLETMLLQARKANVGMVIATQDLARASRAGIADTMIGSTTTKIVSRVVGGDARRVAPTMKTTPEFLLELPDHTFAFASGGEPTVSVRADRNALKSHPKRSDLTKLRELMAEFYGPETDEMSESNRKSNSRKTETAQAELDAQSTMSGNEDHDIKPSDTL